MQTPAALDIGIIHVLRARLDAPPLPIDVLSSFVTEEERQRAARFRLVADAHRHVIGRGIARLALARLGQCEPAGIALRVSAEGKLFLDDGPSFNIAHSGNDVLIGLAATGRLGVDVEAVRALDDLFGVARASFVASEVEALMQRPDAEQLRHFYRTWSRKEAMLKALGVGIGALQSLTVSADLECDNALIRLDLPNERMEEWVVRPVPCSDVVETAVAWDQPLRAVIVTELAAATS